MPRSMKPFVCAVAAILIVLGAVLVDAWTSESSGGSAYVPAVPNAPQVYGGGYGGAYYSPGTAAGSAMNGMANMAQAAGSRNLANSAAAVNMTQARKQSIQNYSSATTTYFQMRQLNTQAREAERGPRLSEAELARLAKAEAPKQLSARQLNPVDGAIAWPPLLQDDKFESQRALLDKAFSWRARYGNFNLTQLEKVQETTDSMLRRLKDLVREADPMEYAQAKDFVRSLASEARKPVS